MNRRELFTGVGMLSAGAITGITPSLLADSAIAPATRRTRALAGYEDLHFGVSYHFSMNTFTGDDYETGKVPASTYNPTPLDVRQ